MATPRVVRLGAHRDFPPFCRFEDDHANGLVIERVTAALADTGFELDWHPLALPDMAGALERGEVDLLCGTGASADRSRDMDFSDPIVITGGAGFAAAGRSDIDLEGGPAAWGAAGLRAVSPAAGPLLAGLSAVAGLETGDGVDYATSLAMALDGRADVAALNFHVARAMAERDHPGEFRLPERPYLEVALVAAAPKGMRGDLIAALNAGLRRLPPA